MINLFSPSASDQSVQYLAQIFGYMGAVLPIQAGVPAPLIVGLMFKFLNTMALTVGAILVVYVVVVGLLKTAQEGEFLGKQWNSLWVPIRTVLGIAALFPTATGYSAIQIIIMWIVLQGVGAADTLWTKVLQYVSVAGSPYAGVSISAAQTQQTQGNMQRLFQSLVCQATAKATYPSVKLSEGVTVSYYCSDFPNDQFCTKSNTDMLNPLTGTSNTYTMGPTINNNNCGTLTYCDASTKGDCAPDPNNPSQPTQKCLVCKAQQAAIQTIVPTLGAIAQQIAALDYQYLQFYETAGATPPGWVQNFCSAQNIPADQCCVQPASSSVPGAPAQTCSTSSFPSDYGTSSNGGPQYNTTSSASSLNATAATNLYLQYSLQSYLNGSDFINAAVGEYNTAVASAISTYIQNQAQKPLTDWENTAQQLGWIMAGGFFYKMAGMNGNNIQDSNPGFAASGVASGVAPLGSTRRDNSDAAANLVTAMVTQNQATSPAFGIKPEMSNNITDALGSGSSALADSWQKNLTSGKGSVNPLISVAAFGYNMMLTAQVLFVVLAAFVAYMVGAGTVNAMVVGTGLTMSPLGEALKAIANFVGPFFVILIVALYGIGALLGIYVPLIPYMVFTIGAIGWLIAVVEAMVAAPIIALGILSPGGQHDILGRAEPALMQIFNLFLRPMLMILGLVIAMLLSVVVVNLINAGFLAVSSEVIPTAGLFEQIIFIAAYTSFLITALNKTFSLIYTVPEKVLTYIGGPAVQYGEAEALGTTKQVVEGAASGVSGAGREAGGSIMPSGQAIGLAALKDKEEREKREKRDAAALNAQQKAEAAKKNGGS